MAGLGLYVHIPFCEALCHYCDFAKTARFDVATKLNYIAVLRAEWADWKRYYRSACDKELVIDTLYFGGGTPSVYADELAGLVDDIRPDLSSDAEITFEVNPEHVMRSNLLAWKALGINRLSLGVQSFQGEGLKFLTRRHSPEQARAAIAACLEEFADVSVDLIYGWTGQSLELWQQELQELTHYPISHCSLYVLTYAEGTPIGRRQQRGLIQDEGDELLAQKYGLAQNVLAAAGFVQEEVSNWARPQFFAKHNRKYWQQEYFFGLGVGAHGFLPAKDRLGWRFFHRKQLQTYLRMLTPQPTDLTAEKASSSEQDAILSKWQLESDVRVPRDWVLEALGSGLRCVYGIDLKKIQNVTALGFKPTPFLADQLARGTMLQLKGDRLILDASEWFREMAWCHEIEKAFTTEAVS